MKYLKYTLVTFIILFILLIAAVSFLIYTNSGLRVIVVLAEKFVPELSIKQVNGTISNLSLGNINYKKEGIDIDIEQMVFSFSGSCLLKKQVCIKGLAVNHANIDIDTTQFPLTEKTASTPLKEIKTPVPISVNSLNLKNINVAINGNKISLAKFDTAADWHKRTITIKPTVIEGVDVTLAKPVEKPVAKHSKKEDVTGLTKEKLNEITHQLDTLFSKPLLQSMPKVILPVDVNVASITGRTWLFHYNRDYRIDNFLLRGKTEHDSVSIDKLSIEGPEGHLYVGGRAQLGENWPLALHIDLAADLPDLNIKEQAKLQLTGSLLDNVNLTLNSTGLFSGKLIADTSPGIAGMPINLSLTVPKVQWPLTASAQYQVDNIALNLTGKVTDYQIKSKFAVKGENIPATTVDLSSSGNLKQIDITSLLVSALKGTILLSGNASWQDSIKWNTALKVNKIDASSEFPDYPLVLNGGLNTSGSWIDKDWSVAIRDVALVGNIKKAKIDVHGNVSGDAKGVWNIHDFDATWGDNVIKINGQMDNKLALNADINAKNLSQILPELSGNVVGKIALQGTLDKPVVDTNLQVNTFRWQTWSVNNAKLMANVKSTEQIAGDVTLNIASITGEGVAANNIVAVLKGNEASHMLTLQSKGEPASGKIALSGKFNRDNMKWSGNLYDSSVITPMGPVVLNKSVDIVAAINDKSVTIGAHCWQHKDAKICLPKPVVIADKGSAEVALDQFDLRLINQLIGRGTVRFRGTLTGNVKADWDTSKNTPNLFADIKGKDITIVYLSGIQLLHIVFEQLNVTGDMHKNDFKLNLLAQLKQNGKVTADILVSDPLNKKGLSGNITIDKITAALLEPLFLDKENNLSGILNGKLLFSGALLDPLVNGEITLKGVKTQGNWIPIDIQNADAVMNFSGKESNLNGLITSTSGKLILKGYANWMKLDNWFAQLSANGQNLEVNIPPMIDMKVSPNLEIEVNNTALNLKGNVDIPWARIKATNLPEGAVDISSDEVMLDENLQPKGKSSNPIAINSNLMIRLGDDISLDAFGLKAKLNGQLLVKQNKNGLGLNGQVFIPNGSFHAYGQDLLIRKGELVFSGPVDQPMLNIEAIRNPNSIENDVVAGLKITGFADAPKVEVFSNPAMSQQEALSYILRGQGLGSDSGADNDVMTSLLIGLGASQGGKYVGKVGEAFGIKNLSFDTQGVGNSSQVVVSGYILPNLQLKYGIGIFDALATVTLRYRLLPRLYMEAVSGLDQTIDLLYQFEF